MSQSLLERIASGDRSAVAVCIDTYSGLVWSLARRFLANDADAEDAVQEIFMEIWSTADRYDANVAGDTTYKLYRLFGLIQLMRIRQFFHFCVVWRL